ncbi:MAG TPA: serine protease [Polyangiaceae bacterium]|nr:serine protease [Polyangiaceae bacterium]
MIPSHPSAHGLPPLGKASGQRDCAARQRLAWIPAALSAVLAASSWACGQPMNQDAASWQRAIEQPVINGLDDRRELYQLASADKRSRIASSVAALMWAHRLDYRAPTVLRTASLRGAIGTCRDEAFAEQPAAAVCSATLIDDDLVLTAGHCLGDPSGDAAHRCQRLLIVFGYHYSQNGELALSGEPGVYTCRRVVHHEKILADDGLMDLAVLQLDRSVAAELTPAVIARSAPRLGDSLLAASHGAGLPLKVDDGGEVSDVHAGGDYFVASTDSFSGGSGSPLFNAEMQLVGHQVRGMPDWQPDGDCMRPAHSDEPREQHQLATRSIQRLCESGWPSERLCRKSAQCGDGVCSGPETVGSCPLDCDAARCGDGACELSERHECSADCAAYANVPHDWMADPASYDPGGGEPEPSKPPVLAPRGCSLAQHEGSGVPWLWSCIALGAAMARRGRRKRAGPTSVSP